MGSKSFLISFGMAEIPSISRNEVTEKPLSSQNPWYVYIIECRTGDLYVGITQDVNERVAKHNKGTACRYTKFRRPVKLIYTEQQTTKSKARQRELIIKKYSHKKKLELAGKR